MNKDGINELKDERKQLQAHMQASVIRLDYLDELIDRFEKDDGSPSRLDPPKARKKPGPKPGKKRKKPGPKPGKIKKITDNKTPAVPQKEVHMNNTFGVKDIFVTEGVEGNVEGESLWHDIRVVLKNNNHRTFTTSMMYDVLVSAHEEWRDFDDIHEGGKTFRERVANAMHQMHRREKLMNSITKKGVAYIRWGAKPEAN
jgi:hypothetical protein